MTEETQERKRHFPAWIKYVIKILVSGLALYFVFTKIDLEETARALSNLNFTYFSIGFLLFILSQIISVVRLGYLCGAEGMRVPFGYNLKLYFIGMAYNLFLPGGIGGDAYKAILFSSRFKLKVKAVVRALLFDRISGLVAISILMVFLISIIETPGSWPFRPWYYLLSIPGVFAVWLIVTLTSKRYVPYFTGTLSYALIVQLLQGMSILMLAYSLRLEVISLAEHFPTLFFIFYSSSIATAIPVFLGGIGAREAVFGGMAVWLGMDEQLMVETAILFSICTIIGSLPGIPLDWIGRRRSASSQ